MKQNLRKRAPLTEKVSVRLPGAMLSRVDALAIYGTPRAIVLRRLVARGLEREEATL